MNLNDLKEAYHHALLVCAPDEYDFRQRKLLHALSEFIIQKETIEEYIDDSGK